MIGILVDFDLFSIEDSLVFVLDENERSSILEQVEEIV